MSTSNPNPPALPAGWINPGADLVGVDGNAFGVMGFTRRELKRAGNPTEVLDEYQRQAQAGDYDHLLRVSIAFCGMLDDAPSGGAA
jgi:hypothetical protein